MFRFLVDNNLSESLTLLHNQKQATQANS